MGGKPSQNVEDNIESEHVSLQLIITLNAVCR